MEVTPPLHTRSPRVRRQRGRLVGFEEAPNMERSRIRRNIEGNGPLKAREEENERQEMNLPPLLAAHLGRNEDGQPSRSSLIFVHRGRQSSINRGGNLPPKASKRGSQKRTWQFKTSNKEKARVSELSPLDQGNPPGTMTRDKEVETEKTFEQPSRLLESKWSRDKTKYYHLHKDHRHDANQCRELKHQIEEAIKSGRLAHLVKGIKKKKQKVSDTQLGERKEERKKPKPAKTHVLMISRKSCNLRKRYVEEDYNKLGEITFPPVTKDKNLADPIIIKAYVSGRQVNRVYIDSGSLCEVIYEPCFLKLKPSIKPLRLDSKTLLVGFSVDHSWPLGEVPLEITIGEGLLTVTKTLCHRDI
uniref:Reverse transcriptase domain-containing protein n=1 Tax=Tanacetum cinerariifolium TaxID=118510 RepID=A0A6L2KE42_TANCI|nr:reverse transcriptase domain-containing protein [Tanacetum cinerariifolium]